MSFWGELKRRNVFKVGVAYIIVAWLIVQVANTFFPILHLPEWAVTLVAVLVILGFPLAILFAWAFELTPEGLKKTEHVPLEESITHLTGQKLNYILIGVIVLGVAYLLFDNFYLDKHAILTEVESRVAELAPPTAEEEEAPKTIAVLPFDDFSPDKDQEYFVNGISEEILNTISRIPDLNVSGRTSSFSFKDSNKTAQEIAEILGVENILEGSVRKAGNALRITAQLIRASDGFHVWSKSYNRELKNVADILSIQEDIATAVANELKLTLGIGESLKQLGGTDNLKAYEHYLFAQGRWNKTVMGEGDIPTTLKRALASIDAALALDHEFALAWAYKSLIHYNLLVFGPVNRADAEQDAALSAAQRAIELEPNLADGYHSIGCIQTSSGKFIEAESSYNRGLELANDTFSYIFVHHFAVGYFERAQEILEGMVRNDNLNLELRGFYLWGLGFLGDMQRVEDEYARGRALFGDEWIWGNVFITVLRLGTDHSVSPDEIVFSNPIYDSAKEHLESPEEGLAELRRVYHDSQTSTDFVNITIWAAYFGDLELSMDSMEKLLKMNAFHFSYCWLPVMREVRQLPRFKELAREFGLVDYWEQFGWPDICRPLDNGDFECD